MRSRCTLLVAVVLWRLLRRGVGALAAVVGALWFATHALARRDGGERGEQPELLVALFTHRARRGSDRARRASAGRGAANGAIALGAGALTAAAVLSKESGSARASRRCGDGVGMATRRTALGWPTAMRGATTALARVRRGARVALIARAVVLGAPVAPASIAAPGLDVLDAGRSGSWRCCRSGRASPDDRLARSLSPYYGPTILPAKRGALATLAVLVALALVALAVVLARRGDRRPLVALGMDRAHLPAGVEPPHGHGPVHRRPDAVRSRRSGSRWRSPGRSTACRAARASRCCSSLRSPSSATRSAARATPSAWSSHRTLWERLVETSPAEYRGYQLLGIDAREHGDTTRALPLLARAFAMEPRDRRVRFEYGQVLYSTGALRRRRRRCWRRCSRDGDVRREPQFVAMYLDAVGRARGAEAVVAAGTPLLRSESAAVAALYVGAAARAARPIRRGRFRVRRRPPRAAARFAAARAARVALETTRRAARRLRA